ncbi:ABC transporter permease [Cardinium endosymbiont of Tipula unca]|uniref:ABC transporter permease n=1 Tax=Cardinium endosymbiont of Tipula unca TaxID=3066216 RepID=UPI0030D4D590
MRQGNRGAFSDSIHKIVTLSIAIGFASILVASMVMLGFQSEITKKLTSFCGHFEITKYTGHTHLYESQSICAAQIDGLVNNLPIAIEKIEAFAQKPVLIHTKSGIEGILCKGLDHRTLHKELESYLVAGRLPNLTDLRYQNELLISEYFAKKLSIGLSDSVIVHTIHPTVRFRKLKIVGMYRTYINDIDTSLAFCDIRLIQRLNNWTSEIVNGYEVFVKDGFSITKNLRDGILRLIDYDLRLVKTDQKYPAFYDWLAIIQKNTAIFILFILLIACFTMVATVIIQIMERSYMVGLLKSLGAYAWQIHAIILCNSLRTLCWGMLYGNILGIGLCFLQGYYKLIRLEPALYYMHYVPIYWSWKAIFFPNLVAFGTIGLALYCTIKLLNKNKVTEVLQESKE